MATATLHFIEITLRFEPNTSSFSILASEDAHATHKADFTASSVDAAPDQLLKDLLRRIIEVYPDPKGKGIQVQVTGDSIVSADSSGAITGEAQPSSSTRKRKAGSP